MSNPADEDSLVRQSRRQFDSYMRDTEQAINRARDLRGDTPVQANFQFGDVSPYRERTLSPDEKQYAAPPSGEVLQRGEKRGHSALSEEDIAGELRDSTLVYSPSSRGSPVSEGRESSRKVKSDDSLEVTLRSQHTPEPALRAPVATPSGSGHLNLEAETCSGSGKSLTGTSTRSTSPETTASSVSGTSSRNRQLEQLPFYRNSIEGQEEGLTTPFGTKPRRVITPDPEIRIKEEESLGATGGVDPNAETLPLTTPKQVATRIEANNERLKRFVNLQQEFDREREADLAEFQEQEKLRIERERRARLQAQEDAQKKKRDQEIQQRLERAKEVRLQAQEDAQQFQRNLQREALERRVNEGFARLSADAERERVAEARYLELIGQEENKENIPARLPGVSGSVQGGPGPLHSTPYTADSGVNRLQAEESGELRFVSCQEPFDSEDRESGDQRGNFEEIVTRGVLADRTNILSDFEGPDLFADESIPSDLTEQVGRLIGEEGVVVPRRAPDIHQLNNSLSDSSYHLAHTEYPEVVYYDQYPPLAGPAVPVYPAVGIAYSHPVGIPGFVPGGVVEPPTYYEVAVRRPQIAGPVPELPPAYQEAPGELERSVESQPVRRPRVAAIAPGVSERVPVGPSVGSRPLMRPAPNPVVVGPHGLEVAPSDDNFGSTVVARGARPRQSAPAESSTRSVQLYTAQDPSPSVPLGTVNRVGSPAPPTDVGLQGRRSAYRPVGREEIVYVEEERDRTPIRTSVSVVDRTNHTVGDSGYMSVGTPARTHSSQIGQSRRRSVLPAAPAGSFVTPVAVPRVGGIQRAPRPLLGQSGLIATRPDTGRTNLVSNPLSSASARLLPIRSNMDEWEDENRDNLSDLLGGQRDTTQPIVRRPHGKIPPPRDFKGLSDESPIEWLEDMEAYVRFNMYDDEVVGHVIRMFLKGPARIWFTKVSPVGDPISWEVFKEQFKERFDRHQNKFVQEQKVMNRKFKKGEALDSYISDIVSAASRLNWDDDRLRSALMSGLPSDLRKLVMMQGPVDSQDCIGKMHLVINGGGWSDTSADLHYIKGRMDELFTKVDSAGQAALYHVQNGTSEGTESAPPAASTNPPMQSAPLYNKSGAPGPPNGPPVYRSLPSCWTCGELGHFARNCPQTPPSMTQPAMGPGHCYNCGDPTHYANRCPLPRRPGPGYGTPPSAPYRNNNPGNRMGYGRGRGMTQGN